jgi:hypothetical protein
LGFRLPPVIPPVLLPLEGARLCVRVVRCGEVARRAPPFGPLLTPPSSLLLRGPPCARVAGGGGGGAVARLSITVWLIMVRVIVCPSTVD